MQLVNIVFTSQVNGLVLLIGDSKADVDCVQRIKVFGFCYSKLMKLYIHNIMSRLFIGGYNVWGSFIDQ